MAGHCSSWKYVKYRTFIGKPHKSNQTTQNTFKTRNISWKSLEHLMKTTEKRYWKCQTSTCSLIPPRLVPVLVLYTACFDEMFCIISGLNLQWNLSFPYIKSMYFQVFFSNFLFFAFFFINISHSRSSICHKSNSKPLSK